ncbi:MAG: flavodoxin domain-containing protein [Clostridiales bacterium]|nr:flavodoxin domain-containing protein [Clostridiales bacterium]
MSKVAIVYWSGTGNTAAMAAAVLEGAKAKGAEAESFTSAAFSASMMDDFDAVAFGCPAMGAEVLEESEFDPMFAECEGRLGGKKIALFGSYGWGSGEWMENWEDVCRNSGAQFACDYVICNGMPDADGLEACKALGAALA